MALKNRFEAFAGILGAIFSHTGMTASVTASVPHPLTTERMPVLGSDASSSRSQRIKVFLRYVGPQGFTNICRVEKRMRIENVAGYGELVEHCKAVRSLARAPYCDVEGPIVYENEADRKAVLELYKKLLAEIPPHMEWFEGLLDINEGRRAEMLGLWSMYRRSVEGVIKDETNIQDDGMYGLPFSHLRRFVAAIAELELSVARSLLLR